MTGHRMTEDSYVSGISDVAAPRPYDRPRARPRGGDVGRPARRWSRRPRACAGPGPSCRNASTRFAAGLLALGLEPRRPHRHLVAELRRMDADAVRDRARRTDPGHHQSGLPALRARVHAQQGRLQGAGHGDRASRPATMSRCSRRWRRSLRQQRPATLSRRPAAASAHGDPDRRAAGRPAALAFDDVAARGRRRGSATSLRALARRAAVRRSRSTSSSPAAPPARPRARR